MDDQQLDQQTLARTKSVRETLTDSNTQTPDTLSQTQQIDPSSLSVKEKIAKLENNKVGDNIQKQTESVTKQPKVGVKL